MALAIESKVSLRAQKSWKLFEALTPSLLFRLMMKNSIHGPKAHFACLTLSVAMSLAFAPSAQANFHPNSSRDSSSVSVDGKSAPGTDAAVRKLKLYEIGYSHLDTEWCWTYPQVIREFIPNTLHENFALFKQFPDYVFNWTGSNRYRFMKEYYPEDYQTLKKYIAEGRWFPAGSSIEEGDVNSPSEESLVRQVMYGNEFFRNEFGKASNEFMLPDCFGFPYSLPSILAHCGLKGFSTQKLTWGSAVGIPFDVGRWVGPDGHYIIGALNGGSYGSTIDDNLSTDQGWEKHLQDDYDKYGVGVTYRYFGVGDRGGAPGATTVQNLEDSLHGTGPVEVIGGSADTMFKDLTPAQINKLPSYRGDLELTQHSAGSLTSEATQKRWNHKNELLGDSAERASVAANWLGAEPYDQSRITDAWLRFLPGQFHDLMAGTALPLAYTYSWNDEVIAQNEFAGVIKQSVGAVARGLNTEAPSGQSSLVVYNPLSIDRSDIAEARVNLNGANRAVAYGPNGSSTPVQIIGTSNGIAHVIFKASVPANGFAVYRIKPVSGESSPSSLKITSNSLENSRYKVTINSDGDVSSIYDKVAGQELLSAPARLEYQHENPDNWPAWNMDWKDQNKPPRGYVSGTPTVKIVENGPVRVTLQLVRDSEGSHFIQNISLDTVTDRVNFNTNVDWRGKEAALKAAFPLAVSNPDATFNWELGTIKRGNNFPKRYEDAFHKWFDLTDTSGKYGVSVLSQCKYGSDKPNDNTMRLTLLYTPGTNGGYQHQGTQDWGRQNLTYAVYGHQGDWSTGGTQWEAQRLDQPLVAFNSAKHNGILGKTFSFAKVSTNQVQIEAMKKAEASTGTIIRLNELEGRSASNVKVSFTAPIVSAFEVNGQEQRIGPAKVVNGKLIVSMGAYEPKAYEVVLRKPGESLSAPKSTPLSLPMNLDGASNWDGKTDGNFDGNGDTFPGDLMPSSLKSGGVQFKLASTEPGRKNFLVPNGQTISLPEGKNRKLYILASALTDGHTAKVAFGNKVSEFGVQKWDGYIGQWDTRIWKGVVPELTYDWNNALGGLVPGYIKRDQVAWYADHFRQSDGSPAIYQFCYLFRYAVPIPNGARSVTFPKDSGLRIAAASVSSNPNEAATNSLPLYDTLADHHQSAPSVTVAPIRPNDAAMVTIHPGNYWSPSFALHYTLDGTRPTANSPVYDEPFLLSRPATIRVQSFDGNDASGPETSFQADVKDTVSPSLTSAFGMTGSNVLTLQFSEPLDPSSATDVSHYRLINGGQVTSAKLTNNGTGVELTCSQPMTNMMVNLGIIGVKDLSPMGNPTSFDQLVGVIKPVVLLDPDVDLDGSHGMSQTVDNLPVHAGDSWTINTFVKMSEQPHELTIIGGFGDANDSGGQERFIVKFHDSIQFWGSNVDIGTGVPFDLNKWQMITVTYDGSTVRIYKNGKLLKAQAAHLNDASPTVQIAPKGPWDESASQFNGDVNNFSVWKSALPADFIQSLLSQMPS